METMEVNYWAIASGAVLSMIISPIWYGHLFGKKCMGIVGVNPADLEARKKMQKSAGPLYAVQLSSLLQFTLSSQFYQISSGEI
jgi:hypothetical protein